MAVVHLYSCGRCKTVVAEEGWHEPTTRCPSCDADHWVLLHAEAGELSHGVVFESRGK